MGAVGFTGQTETATMADQMLSQSKIFQDAFQMMSFNNNFGPVFADMRRAGHEKQVAKIQAKAQKQKRKGFGALGAGIGAAVSAGGAAAMGADPTGMLVDTMIGSSLGGGIGSAFGE